jgi:biopolymer transport protein ExbB
VILAVCLLTNLGVPHGAWATADDFSQHLQAAIEQTQEELEQETERFERENAARQEQLNRTRALCQDRSDELVERRMAIANKQQELTLLRRQREALWTEQTQWQRELAEIELICRDVRRELTELAEAKPVSEHRDEQSRQLAQLGTLLDEDDPKQAVSATVALLTSFLNEARTQAVFEADIIDARGKLQRAMLLRLGQNLFAYHILATGQTAVAISAPYEQAGFRWHEDLPETMQRALVAAMDRDGKTDSLVWVPLDVTGRMTATTNLSNRTLADRLRSGGVVMIPLAFVAVCLTLLVADRLLVLLREGRHSLRFCERVLSLCSQGKFEQAQQLAEQTKGVLSRTLQACLAHRHHPPAVLDDAIQETLLHEFPRLERFLPSIRLLSSLAPMLGLLGTVTGIIETFDVITVVGSGQPRLMAGGISEALITTATGLAIAIPGLLAHSVLSGKVNGIIADTERFAATLSNLVKQQSQTTSEDRRPPRDGRQTAD